MDTVLQIPQLFMSANWFSEKTMVKLFIAGIQQGVRGFDTAREYGVEKKVGRALRSALKETGLKREDVFIQSRICNEELVAGVDVAMEVDKSLDKMGLDYFDSFMFHWPTPEVFIPAWNDLTKVYLNTKKLKSVGMCNCRLRHLSQMKNTGVEILPQILQVEVTPFWQIKELKEFCDVNHIRIQAFSPLCKMIKPIREDAILSDMSKKYRVSIAQIILRWHLQRGIIPISSSSRVDRIRANFDILGFALSENDMSLISSLDCGYKYHLESSTCFGF